MGAIIVPFFKIYILIFDFREREREREKEGEKHQCERETSIGCLLCVSQPGTNLQPRHVPLLGIELVTFQFVG